MKTFDARVAPLFTLPAPIVWEAAVAALKIPPAQLPPPSLIVATLVANAPLLLGAAATTLSEALQALALAAAAGVGLALAFSWSATLERAFLPVAVALQVTPLIAVAPLLLIYLEPRAAVLACAGLVAFFPILSNASAGLKAADRRPGGAVPAQGRVAREILLRLRLPSALPSIFTGLELAPAWR